LLIKNEELRIVELFAMEWQKDLIKMVVLETVCLLFGDLLIHRKRSPTFIQGGRIVRPIFRQVLVIYKKGRVCRFYLTNIVVYDKIIIYFVLLRINRFGGNT
jgi:hypothetical protein